MERRLPTIIVLVNQLEKNPNSLKINEQKDNNCWSGLCRSFLSVLLSQRHSVIAMDIDEEKVNLINKHQSPIKDKEIEDYLKQKTDLKATINKNEAYKEANFIIIAVPTKIIRYFNRIIQYEYSRGHNKRHFIFKYRCNDCY